jgi:hypothetical protein
VKALAAVATVALLAAACSDEPSTACLHGMVREPGPACTLPPTLDMIVDGRRDDWTNPKVFDVLVPGSCCATADNALTNAGRQLSDGQLVFFSSTLGPPFDTSLVYGLSFRRVDLPDDDPANVHTLFLTAPDLGGSVEAYVNGVRVFGAPGSAALGDSGIEWRLPPEALPYPGVAEVIGVAFESQDGQAVVRHPAKSAARICWDPDAADDPCRAE